MFTCHGLLAWKEYLFCILKSLLVYKEKLGIHKAFFLSVVTITVKNN